MSNFEKLMGVLADNPAIAEKIAADTAPSGGVDVAAIDPTRITAGLLGLAQEHGIVLTEAELRHGLVRTALDHKADMVRLMKDRGVTLTEAELEQGLSLAANDDGMLSDADLDQVTGGLLVTIGGLAIIMGLATFIGAVGIAGTIGGYYLGKRDGAIEGSRR